MSALFKRKHRRPLPSFTPSDHIAVLADDDIPVDSSIPSVTSVVTLVRHVRIGDRIFTLTPSTVFRGIQSDGSDYYPFYDDNLHDATDDDIATPGHDYYSLTQLWSQLQ